MEQILKYKNKLESIKQSDILNHQRKNQLSELLSEMAYEFSVPLFPSEEFKEKNKDVMDIFYEIVKEFNELSKPG